MTYFSLADRFNAAALFSVSAAAGAVFNACPLAAPSSFALWAFMRLCTGVCLAGVYPVGMKIAAKAFPKGLGFRLGLLVGALTLGTGFPWLLRAVGSTLPLVAVVVVPSVLSAVGGIVMWLVFRELSTAKAIDDDNDDNDDNEDDESAVVLVAATGKAALRAIFATRAFTAALLGYWGHMFELYAFWAFVPALVDARPSNVWSTEWISFVVIGVCGTLGCVAAGLWAVRADAKTSLPGPIVPAVFALGVSGTCCLLVPASNAMSDGGFLAFLCVWGFTVIADSAQYSTLVAQNAPKAYVGTALTLSTCVGFALTVVAIQLVSVTVSSGVEPRLALLILGIGPAVGLVASYRQWPIHRLAWVEVEDKAGDDEEACGGAENEEDADGALRSV